MKRLKRVVIKEELVALTNDFKLAIVLNQFLYWTERMVDVGQMVAEEKTLRDASDVHSYRHGWISKTSVQLAEECMMNCSEATMRRYLNELVQNGWLMRRANARHKWDKTFQYRVNIEKIQSDLEKIGYVLEGYPPLTQEKQEEVSSHERVYQKFVALRFGPITKTIQKSLAAWLEKLSPDIVLKALETAAEFGKRNWNYVQALLTDWKANHLQTVRQIDAYLQTRRKPVVRKEKVPKWVHEPYKEKEQPDDFEEEKRKLEEKLKAFRKKKESNTSS